MCCQLELDEKVSSRVTRDVFMKDTWTTLQQPQAGTDRTGMHIGKLRMGGLNSVLVASENKALVHRRDVAVRLRMCIRTIRVVNICELLGSNSNPGLVVVFLIFYRKIS